MVMVARTGLNGTSVHCRDREDSYIVYVPSSTYEGFASLGLSRWGCRLIHGVEDGPNLNGWTIV